MKKRNLLGVFLLGVFLFSFGVVSATNNLFYKYNHSGEFSLVEVLVETNSSSLNGTVYETSVWENEGYIDRTSYVGDYAIFNGNNTYIDLGKKPGELITYLKFENNLNDESSNDYNFSMVGDSLNYVSGDSGQGLNFSGEGYLTLEDSADFDFNTTLMVSLSFATNGTGSDMPLIGQWSSDGNQRGWLLRLTDNGNLGFYVSPDGTTVSAGFSITAGLDDGGLHRVSVLWAAGGVYYSIDGGPSEFVTLVHDTIFDSSANITLGGRADEAANFSGVIDEVQIYNGGRSNIAEDLSQNLSLTLDDVVGNVSEEELPFLNDEQGTISIWFYLNNDISQGAEHPAIFSYGGNRGHGSSSSGIGFNIRKEGYADFQSVYFYQGNEDEGWTNWSVLNSDIPINSGEWNHLVIMSNGTYWTHYINGNEGTFLNDETLFENHGDWFADTHFKGGGEAISVGSRLWGVWGGGTRTLYLVEWFS